MITQPHPFPWKILLPLVLIGSMHAGVWANETTQKAMRILRDECINCHKPGKARGGLLLHQHEKMLEGGDTGPAVVPGNPDESLTFELVLEDADPHMPPKKQLTEEQIQILKNWILEGATWDASVFDELPPAQPVETVAASEAYQPALALALSPDQTQLAVAQGGKIFLAEIKEKEVHIVRAFEAHAESVQTLVWHPDGTRLYTGGFQKIRAWKLEDLSQIHEFHESLLGAITTLAISKDGNTLMASDGAVGGAGFVHHFDLNNLTRVHSWKAHEDTIYSMQFSPDGTQVLTGSADKTVKLWKVEDHTLLSTFEGHTSHVLAVTFDLDGKRIASAGADREVKLWNVEKVEQIISLSHSKDPYISLDWIETGDFLVTLPENGVPSLYSEFVAHNGEQSSSGTKRRALERSPALFTNLKATRNGEKLFGTTFEGQLIAWDVPSGKPSPVPLTVPVPVPEPPPTPPPAPEAPSPEVATPPSPSPAEPS